jgi:hypothetical protein
MINFAVILDINLQDMIVKVSEVWKVAKTACGICEFHWNTYFHTCTFSVWLGMKVNKSCYILQKVRG